LLRARRNQPIFTTVVNLAELAVLVHSESDLARFFAQFRVLPLHFGAAVAAGQLDRRLRKSGDRLGEADTLIAGIALYNGQVSRDAAFDRVPGLRRIPHEVASPDES
jgi:predicted nucleic acid-binding protein